MSTSLEIVLNIKVELDILSIRRFLMLQTISCVNKRCILFYHFHFINSCKMSLQENWCRYTIIIYQLSKFSFLYVSLVESLSREIVEIRLSPSHQRTRETMHYSLVNNKKITCAITRTHDLWTAETHECFVNDIVYRIKFNVFYKINKIFRVFSYEVRFIFSFL